MRVDPYGTGFIPRRTTDYTIGLTKLTLKYTPSIWHRHDEVRDFEAHLIYIHPLVGHSRHKLKKPPYSSNIILNWFTYSHSTIKDTPVDL